MTRGTAVSRVYIHARIYIYIHVHVEFHGPRRFPGSSATVEYARVYTFHSRGRRNLDDTENEPTVWLHIVAAYLCAVHLLRHDVPASNNPVQRQWAREQAAIYLCDIHTARYSSTPPLRLVYFALVSPPPRVTCFSFSIVCSPHRSRFFDSVPRPCARVCN